MKIFRSLVAVLALGSILANTLVANAASWSADQSGPFPDVREDHYNSHAISYLKDNEIVAGYPDGTYKPDKTLQRAELMKIVVLGRGIDPDAATNHQCFKDVNDEWFAPYICYAKQKGWISGYSDGSFGPANEVNLVEALKIMENIFELNPDEVPLGDTLPEDVKGQWYTSFINAAAEFGILEDRESIDPGKKLTRGWAAEYLYRVAKLSTYRDLYVPGTWKNSKGEKIGIEHAGLIDGSEKTYEVESEGVKGEEVYTLKNECTKGGTSNCFTLTHTSQGADGKISTSNTVVEVKGSKSYLLSEDFELMGETHNLVYLEKPVAFEGQNRLSFLRPKSPISMVADNISFEIFDMMVISRHDDNEIIDTPLGKKEAARTTTGIISNIYFTAPNGEVLDGTLYIEYVNWAVAGIGEVKGEVESVLFATETEEELNRSFETSTLTKFTIN